MTAMLVPADLYLLYAANRGYVNGQSHTLVVDRGVGYGCFYVVALAALGIVLPIVPQFFQEETSKADQAVIACLVLAVVVLLTVVAALEIRLRRRDRYLLKHGAVILGQVIESRPTVVSSQRSMAITYAFPSPDGREIRATASAFSSSKLSEEAFPKRGRPVAILYVDDSTFRLL